jgi:uncharacterized membrane protein
MAPRRGFFAKLFDLSFSEFIAVQIAGVLYGVGIVIIGLGCLAAIFAGLSRGVGPGLVTLVIVPVLFLLYVIFFRIALESFIAAIRTAENTSRIAEYLRR